MPDVDACAICKGNSKWTALTRDEFENECPRCGTFEITGTAAALEKNPDVRRKLSGWVHGRNRDGIVPLITSDTLARMGSLRLPSIAERAERLLLEAVHGQERLDNRINLDEPRFVAATYSWDLEETRVLQQLLKRRGWIESVAYGARGAEVTVEGYMAADELTAERAQSEEVFVAMSFSPQMTSAYETGLQVGIECAGYVPIRVDRTEHVNRIATISPIFTLMSASTTASIGQTREISRGGFGFGSKPLLVADREQSTRPKCGSKVLRRRPLDFPDSAS